MGHGYKDEASPMKAQLKRWLFTTNHKDIGILYLFTSLIFFFFAGALALVMRTQLYVPNNTLVNAYYYNQLVTTHGLLMVFFFISAFAFSFANYVVPIQVGAKDMAFPRLNALSYWLYLFAGILFITGYAMPGGNIAGGWTIYQPLNQIRYSPQAGENAAILALIVLSISVIVSTVNFAVTIALKRAKGYRWIDLPMFTISIMFTIMMMWMAFPIFALDLGLLFIGRVIGASVLLSPVGGALLWQHLFWFFGHPEVYIVFLPALGIMYDVSSLFSGMPIYTKKLMIGAFAIETLMSLTVYMHHMFMTGTNLFWLNFANVNTLIIGIPAGVLVLGELTTKIKGTFRPETPALFTVGGVIAFIIGGASGIFLANIALDSGFNGNYPVVGHFHYIFAGTILFGIYSGLYYWFPKMFGRMYSEKLGKLHFVASFVGLNLLYFPMLALINMPRRYYTYPAGLGFTSLNQLATIGSYIFGFAQLIVIINIIYSIKRGKPASDNPWGGWSYEWLIPTPPPEFNFDGVPVVQGDRLLILPEVAGASETEHHGGGHLSPWPFALSLGIFVSLFGLTLYTYFSGIYNLVIGIGLMIFSIAVIGWFNDDYHDYFPVVERDDDPNKETWPFRNMDSKRLGMWVFITGDMFMFFAMLGAALFVIWQSPYFSSPLPKPLVDMTTLGVSIVVLGGSIVSLYAAHRGVRSDNKDMTVGGLVLTIIFALIYLGYTMSNWSQLAASGNGISNIAESPLLSVFYDAGIVHMMHIIAAIALLIYFLIKGLNGKLTSKMNSPSIAALLYFWGLIAVMGILLNGAFAMA